MHDLVSLTVKNHKATRPMTPLTAPIKLDMNMRATGKTSTRRQVHWSLHRPLGHIHGLALHGL